MNKIKKLKFIDLYFVFSLVLFFVLPLTSFFRRLFIENLNYELWTNFPLFFGVIGLLIIVIDNYCNFCENYKEILKKFFNVQNCLLLAFILWITISTFINNPNIVDLFGNSYSKAGLTMYISYLLFYVNTKFFKNDGLKKYTINVFIIIGLIISILLCFDCLILNYKLHLVDGAGIFYNSNHLGYYLVVLCICSLITYCFRESKYFKIVDFVTFVFSFIALILSNCLGSIYAYYIGVIFSIIIFSLTNRKNFIKKVIICFVVSLLSLFILVNVNEEAKTNFDINMHETYQIFCYIFNLEKEWDDKIGNNRMEIYKSCIKMMKEKPIFGYGLCNMRVRLQHYVRNQDTPHCEFFEYGTVYGIPAMLLYCVWILSIYLKGLKHRKELTDLQVLGFIVAFAYLVSSAVGVTMFYTAPYLFIFLGIADTYKKIDTD